MQSDFEVFKFELLRKERQVIEPTNDTATAAIDGWFEKDSFRRTFGFDAPELQPVARRLRSEPEDDVFFKRFGDSRRVSLRHWIRKSLSRGESLASLVHYAERFDRAEGALIAEIGAEIEAEVGA